MNNSEKTMDKIVALCKTRGFIFPGSEIYGGLANSWDYGPLGVEFTMGRMNSDAQFAGSSSVPAHVEMMGFLGIGNNPMVGATVAVAVDVSTALSK